MPPPIVTARSMGLTFRTNVTAMGPETSVVGHYSAGRRARNRTEGIVRAKSFHDFHLSKGWAGIGYHYLISDDGAIICCRSTFHQGAHVDNNNKGRIGVNMPGTLTPTIRDRPTVRQARAFNWLLHNAHTSSMPRAHRTDRDLSRVPRFGHKDLMATSCPGLFLGMYKRGGDPWVEPASEAISGTPPFVAEDESISQRPAGYPAVGVQEGLVEGAFVALAPEDEELLVLLGAGQVLANPDDPRSGPDEQELAAGTGVEADDVQELPEADDEFDEDLTELLAEIEPLIGDPAPG